jgi:hypothetical protein
MDISSLGISTLTPIVSTIAAAAMAYLKSKAMGDIAGAAAGKAAERVAEKAGESVTEFGAKALTTMRSWFRKKQDSDAEHALDLVERNPDDKESHQQLIRETTRVALDDPSFAKELRQLAEQITIVQGDSFDVTFNNTASNEGVQAGQINAPITINRGESE